MVMPSQRLVDRIPVTALWDSNEEVDADRERWLSKSILHDMLQKYPVEFYVADVGHPLRRIDIDKCYYFWKSDVAKHLVDDPEGGISYEDFPGAYCYVASEWSGNIQVPIVLLEKYH
jgi:hypothetical protein